MYGSRLLPKASLKRNRNVIFLNDFLQDEEGQDMVEYTLLLAFVALAAGAAYVTIGNNISSIWRPRRTSPAPPRLRTKSAGVSLAAGRVH